MSSPFVITTYDKAFTRTGLIGKPTSLELHLRHNDLPTGRLTVAAGSRAAALLLPGGSRVTIDYLGQQVFSGVTLVRTGTGGPNGLVTFELHDDWRLLSNVLGWPNPTSAINAQTASAYDTKTGPAETVVKWFAGRAFTRLGLPVTIATDAGRGSTVTVSMRMHPLTDKLLPRIDQAGIGVTIRQVGSGLVLDCYSPAWFGTELSYESGIVQDWSWAQNGPTVTRAVVGLQGEGTARVFRQAVSSDAETAWGPSAISEVFVDARDTADTTVGDDRANAAITDGAPTSGLRLTLAEGNDFRYGVDVRVGDLVTTRLVPGAPAVTDVLREAVLQWTERGGLTVQPVVGDRTDDPSRALSRVLRRTLAAVRNINART